MVLPDRTTAVTVPSGPHNSVAADVPAPSIGLASMNPTAAQPSRTSPKGQAFRSGGALSSCPLEIRQAPLGESRENPRKCNTRELRAMQPHAGTDCARGARLHHWLMEQDEPGGPGQTLSSSGARSTLHSVCAPIVRTAIPACSRPSGRQHALRQCPDASALHIQHRHAGMCRRGQVHCNVRLAHDRLSSKHHQADRVVLALPGQGRRRSAMDTRG